MPGEQTIAAIAADPQRFADHTLRVLHESTAVLLQLLAGLELVADQGEPHEAGERTATAIVEGLEQLERWAASELPKAIQRARGALERIKRVS